MPPNNSGVRAFIALSIPTKFRETVLQVQATLQAITPPEAVRWVAADGFHLTLFFLGDVTTSQIDALQTGIGKVAITVAPFSLNTADLGCFPHRRRPRVVWLGVKGEIDPLTTLKNKIDQTVTTLGWPADRYPFRPHITLGRITKSGQAAAAGWPFTPVDQAATWVVQDIHLMRSQFDSRRGVIYTSLYSASLAGT